MLEKIEVVKTSELKSSLLFERKTFADWDNERRKRVDLVIDAINISSNNASLTELQSNLLKIINGNPDLVEIKEAAIKMLRIHYKKLERTPKERIEYILMRKRAEEKLEKYFKKNS